MSKRITKAREPVSPAPNFVSQLTSLALLGIDPKRFRETFGAHPSAVRVGKLVLIEAGDAREVLRSLRGTVSDDGIHANDADDDDDEDGDVPRRAPLWSVELLTVPWRASAASQA